MVFIHHFNPIKDHHSFFGAFFNELHVGVTIFFVLSGFLIAYRYYDKVKVSKQWVFEYFLNRVARIYPMYFILTILTFVIIVLQPGPHFVGYIGHNLKLLFLNLTFFRGFFDEYKFSLIAQGWSLTVEECFYFAAPVFFILIRKFKPAIGIIPVVLVAFGLLLVQVCKGLSFHGFFNSNFFLFNYTFFGRCFEFFIGMALALLFKKKKGDHPLQAYSIATYGGLVLSLAGIWLLSAVKGNYEFGLYTTTGRVINNVIIPVFVSIFFLGLITERSVIRKVLETSLFQVLGKSSYVFYLIHLGVIQVFISTYINSNMAINFILLNLVSILFYYCLEHPLNNKIRALKYSTLNFTRAK